MSYRHLGLLVALILLCLPVIIFVANLRAKASLKRLLAERFSQRPFPVLDLSVPSGGSVRLYAAYDDLQGSGFVLVLGMWDRGKVRVGNGAVTSVSNDVAGLFRAGDAAWLEHLRKERHVIVKAAVADGAVALWKGWPSRRSILARLEALGQHEIAMPSQDVRLT